MQTWPNVIGLVGGVGPCAGIDVHQKILATRNGNTEQDLPSVIHFSTPSSFTDRSDFLLGRTPVNPAFAFSKQLKTLDQLGVNAAAIVCNTVHATPIFTEIRSQLQNCSLRYFNIVEETQRRIQQDGFKRIGLLATLGTYQFDLYKNNNSLEIVYPSNENQQRVHDCIYHPQYGVKVHHLTHLSFLHTELTEVSMELVLQDVDAIVLGCTDLPLLSGFEKHIPVPVYDPNQILAETLVSSVEQQLFATQLS